MSDLRDDIRALFTAITGQSPDGLWSAPGEVTLLGGTGASAALSLAIDRRTLVALGLRDDGILRIATTFDDGVVELPLDQLDAAHAGGHLQGWPAHPLGVAWALGRSGVDLGAVPGVDLVIESNVPVGAGLGSSAAVEAAVALALSEVWRAGLDRPALARVAALVARDVVGRDALGEPSDAPRVGEAIAALHGAPRSAVFSDRAGSATVDTVPFDLDAAGLRLLVVDTGAARPDLRDAASAAARDRHAADETVRARDAADLLRTDGPLALGATLDASHSSARAAGLSTPELDLAVETAQEVGALGARMTGSGSGSAVVALVPTDTLSRLQVALDGAFAEHGFSSPELHVVAPSAGAVRDA